MKSRLIQAFAFLLVLLLHINCKSSNAIITYASRTLTNEGNIRIDSTSFRGGFTACEPSICISPADPNVIVAGAILNNAYRSEDGGRSWSKQTLTSSMGVYGDPVIRADMDGQFYYAHLSDPENAPYRSEGFLDRIVVQTSRDNGKTWSDGNHPAIRENKDQDKQWMAIDPQSNHMYMTWTEFDKYGSKNPEDKSRILFSKTMDRGTSWTEPLAINQYDGDCVDSDLTTEGAVPAVGPNGEVYVTWGFDHKLYFDKSMDGGQTWMDQDRVVADQFEGWDLSVPGFGRVNGMPVTEVDLSQGPYKGRIYINWADQRNGTDDTDIWIISSDNNGDTWTTAHRVNDDDTGKHQFFSWMDVDPHTGYVYIVFYDRRHHVDNKTDVYLAYSTDGGQTFTNQKINETSFTPDSKVFLGDYNDISAYGNRIRPIWTQMDEGGTSIWTSLLKMK